jgi:hypothetical protein
MPDSPAEDTITKETCPALYRPPANGEAEPHAHVTSKITRRQVRIEKAAEDGSMPGRSGKQGSGSEESGSEGSESEGSGSEGHWRLCRRELERRGFAHSGTAGARFYRSREEAKSL